MAAAFKEKKEGVLQSLSQPDEEYHDLSPKGTVDEGIRDLIQKINNTQGLVTTSSCAGRVSVFLEGGRSKQRLQDGPDSAEDDAARSGSKGGKGGGRWLFISHDVAELPESSTRVEWREKFGMEDDVGREMPLGSSLVHFKFEPMILHVLAESLVDAQRVLIAAMMAGFRESGVVNVARAGLPMVAVRSMGLGFDSIIGYQDAAGKVVCVVDASYLSSVMQIAKERFKTNTARTKRFQDNLENAYKADREGGSADGIASAKALRRQRKREEGLAIQEEARKVESDRSVGDDTAGTADLAGLFD